MLVYPGWLVSECVTSIMTEQQMRARVRYVIGPDGSPLTVADLPPKDTKRWVVRRKADRGQLVALVWNGRTEKSCGGKQRNRTKTDTGR